MATPERVNWREPLPPDTRPIIEAKASDLFIDRNAQRAVNHDRVARIAQEFDWARFEMPTCSVMEDGRLRVIEGQHRVLAVQMRDPKTTIRVLGVMAGITTLDLGEESGLALAITSNRKPHTVLDKWELRVRRGDPHEVQAQEIIRQHGLRLGVAPTPSSIACVGVISQIIHHGQFTPEMGADALDNTLTIIEGAYPEDQPDSATTRWNHDLVRAVGALVVRNPQINPRRMSQTMRDRIAQQWVAHGASVADLAAWRLIGEALATRYNKSLRSEKYRISL